MTNEIIICLISVLSEEDISYFRLTTLYRQIEGFNHKSKLYLRVFITGLSCQKITEMKKFTFFSSVQQISNC